MIKEIALPRRATALISAAALVAASVAPLVLGSQRASAAQLTSRKVTISSSVVSKTDVGYTAVFTTATAAALEGIVVEFCSDSPLIGASCTAPLGFDSNKTAYAFSVTGHTSNTTTPGVFAKSASANADANTVILTRTDGTSNASGTTITVTFGSTGASDGFTNPSANGTFYARILTYATAAGADNYTSISPGTHTDDGGIALSTANQLTINARVQEQLQFCVGTVAAAATAPADCTGLSGTTVDLGVVDSTTVSVSPVAATNGGNALNGAAMVRTNAANGVVVDYFAEQATSGTEHLGTLRVAGANCNATGSSSDQCFNTNALKTVFTAGTEAFGVAISAVERTGSTTSNLDADTNYLDATATPANFAWQENGSFARLASSAVGTGPEEKVVDDEMLVLRFGATAAVTTPTGAYAVTSTYVATATF
jgi:hypothetical protein